MLILAHKGDLSAVRNRLQFFAGKASIVEGKELAAAMAKPANSEQFVSFDEITDLLEDALGGDWEDWMLFLHPKQKELVKKEFNGPARLRGVSGSGKTIVMIHRARYLARKYQHPVLVITLTHSTRILLDQLLRKLCGPEIGLIKI
jgi:superfamily I DNA and RNA helicase